MNGRNNHEAQVENKASTVEENFTWNNTTDPTQINASQVDIWTVEKKIVYKVRRN